VVHQNYAARGGKLGDVGFPIEGLRVDLFPGRLSPTLDLLAERAVARQVGNLNRPAEMYKCVRVWRRSELVAIPDRRGNVLLDQQVVSRGGTRVELGALQTNLRGGARRPLGLQHRVLEEIDGLLTMVFGSAFSV
jgi:hypothetical protein